MTVTNSPLTNIKMKAIWNNEILADSDRTIEIEGNQYFPPDSINPEFFKPSAATTICGWKGTANYYDIVAGGATNKDAAWFYPQAKDEAKEIENYVAFWKGIEII